MATRIELRNPSSIRARVDVEEGRRFIYLDATFSMDEGRTQQKLAFMWDNTPENHILASRLCQALNEAFS